MNTKNVLVGLLAATAVNAASATTLINPTIEKQQQEKVMTNLLDGLTTVMGHPECTVKNVPE